MSKKMIKYKASSELLKIIKEEINNILKEKIMYHWTRKSNLPLIQAGGLKINQANEYLISRAEMEKIYGCNPICLSTTKSNKYGGKDFVLLEVNVEGIKLLPDIFSMIDKGAYIEGDHLWFEKTPSLLKPVDWNDGVFYYDDLFSERHLIEACIKLTKTACVNHDIEPSRINVYKP